MKIQLPETQLLKVWVCTPYGVDVIKCGDQEKLIMVKIILNRQRPKINSKSNLRNPRCFWQPLLSKWLPCSLLSADIMCALHCVSRPNLSCQGLRPGSPRLRLETITYYIWTAALCFCFVSFLTEHPVFTLIEIRVWLWKTKYFVIIPQHWNVKWLALC